MTNVNKAILSILKTKADAIENLSNAKARHIETLTGYGLEIFDTDGESVQGYFGVRNPETGRELLISKDYGDNVRIYGNGHALHVEKTFTEAAKVIDFLNYLLTPQRPGVPVDLAETMPEQLRFRKAKQLIKARRRAEEAAANARDELKALQESLAAAEQAEREAAEAVEDFMDDLGPRPESAPVQDPAAEDDVKEYVPHQVEVLRDLLAMADRERALKAELDKATDMFLYHSQRLTQAMEEGNTDPDFRSRHRRLLEEADAQIDRVEAELTELRGGDAK